MSKPRSAISFLLDGEIQHVEGLDASTTVLNYLRENLRRTGTKEGCAEGDCGACTVVVAELHAGAIRYRSINSCIQFLPTIDGKALLTVESLKAAMGDALHPVQQAMVDCHGSQCGFCTPGFVMSLFALYKTRTAPSREDINYTLAGNLCRCTGYRPIIEAAEKMYAYGEHLSETQRNWVTAPHTTAESNPAEAELAERLAAIQATTAVELTGKTRYYAPVTLAELAALRSQYPDATILAGGTDVGLWVTKQHRDLGEIIYLGNVAELQTMDVNDQHIEIGAAVSLTDALRLVEQHYPDMHEIVRRFASPPICNAGTLCGNIANASPIGDTMPALISLDSTLLLHGAGGIRELPLDQFYLSYQKTALSADELVQAVRIPLPHADSQFRSYKIAKRYDQDISSVCGAYRLSVADGQVTDIRICYGGMAATPKRAPRCEQALQGGAWTEAAIDAGIAALAQDFTPLSDMRASEGYRRRIAGNLLRRFFLETQGQTATSVWRYAS